MGSSISKEMIKIGPPPCAQCHNLIRCSSADISCTDFERYTNGRAFPTRNPTREIFDRVFSMEDK